MLQEGRVGNGGREGVVAPSCGEAPYAPLPTPGEPFLAPGEAVPDTEFWGAIIIVQAVWVAIVERPELCNCLCRPAWGLSSAVRPVRRCSHT